MRRISLILFIIIFYYLITFFYSFYKITSSITNSNSDLLNQYTNTKNLSKNFNIYFGSFLEENMDLENKKFLIENNNFTFSGELTDAYYNKMIIKIANNLADNFSNTKTILYFYENSNEIELFVKNFFLNLGEYNFEKYMIEKNTSANQKDEENEASENNDKENDQVVDTKEEETEKNDIFSTLIKRYNSTQFFFFTDPIHFKLVAKHQEIIFKVQFKFNGIFWKINKISFPLNDIIKLDKVKILN